MPPADPTTQDPSESPGSDDPDPSRDVGTGPICIQLLLHTHEPDPPLTGWIEPLMLRAVQLTGLKEAQITLVVVEDPQMADLHVQYTGVAGTTDVLTFDLRDQPNLGDEDDVEGDIVICIDEAARQADARKHPLRHELLLYAIHGLMHLVGEDDHDDEGYQRMHQREDELLEQLGVGRLFSTDPNP